MDFRFVARPKYKSLKTLVSQERDDAFRLEGWRDNPRSREGGETWRRREGEGGRDRGGRERERGDRGGTEGTWRKDVPKEALVKSANAYRPGKPLDAEAALKRSVQSSLNKICPENVDVIASQIAEMKITSIQELEVVIGLIMKKALSEAHYCETYADLVSRLHNTMPSFDNPEG